MPPIAAPSLHQPVLATVHGLGRHVRVPARDTEAQRSTVFERQRGLLLGAKQTGVHGRISFVRRGVIQILDELVASLVRVLVLACD